jgi:hypothetical protein
LGISGEQNVLDYFQGMLDLFKMPFPNGRHRAHIIILLGKINERPNCIWKISNPSSKNGLLWSGPDTSFSNIGETSGMLYNSPGILPG